MSIGKRLKIVRGNIKQVDFAKLLSVHPNTVARYERDERSPDAEYLEKVIKNTGFNIQWLATGEGPMRNEFKPALLTLFIEILEDYKNELGEKFTHEKIIEIFNKLYELSSDNFPTSEKAKKKIQSTIIDVFDLLPTLERMVEIEKDRKLAQKIVKSIFEKVLPTKEADREAEELIFTRLIKRGQK